MKKLKNILKPHNIISPNSLTKKEFRNVIRDIVGLYGVKLFYVTSKNKKLYKKDFHGQYIYEDKTITIYLRNTTTKKCLIVTALHELAHHIQEKMMKKIIHYDFKHFKQVLAYEQKTDQLSYDIYKYYFGDSIKIEKDKFISYNNRKTKKWLFEYMKNEQAYNR